MVEKPRLITGIHLLLRRFNNSLSENEYLFHKRVGTGFFDNYFSVPGGHIDGFESPVDCAIRESQEELGISIRHEDLHFVNVIYRIKVPENEVRIDFCYAVTKWQGEIKSNEPDKHSDAKWYPFSKLPQPFVPYIEQAIKDIENKITFTQTVV